MSSIVYVTDNTMIEYHRLQGNNLINFWRPKANKQFSNFKVGDLLFFLVKKTERNNSREKGVVGYGHLASTSIISPKVAWKHYGTLNGADTQEDFYKNILRLSKEELPKKLHCLQLDNVVYFQAPVYLSEIDVSISNNLESFIYLDKLNPNATIEILKKAEVVGIDLWALAVNDAFDEIDSFSRDVISETLGNIHLNINDEINPLSKKVGAGGLNYIKQISKKNCSFIKGSSNHFYYIDGRCLNLFLCCSLNSKNYKNELKNILGMILIYKKLFKEFTENRFTIKCNVITDYNVDKVWQSFITDNNNGLYIINPSLFMRG